jgi:hypothetical protein
MNLLMSLKLALYYYFCPACSVLILSFLPKCYSEGEVLALHFAEINGRVLVPALGDVTPLSLNLGNGVKGTSLIDLGLLLCRECDFYFMIVICKLTITHNPTQTLRLKQYKYEMRHSDDVCLLLLLLQHHDFTASQRKILVSLLFACLGGSPDEGKDDDDDEH